MRRDDELSKSKGTITNMRIPRTKRTGSADAVTLLTPRSLFKSSASDLSAAMVASGQPPATAEALGMRGRPVLMAHVTILTSNQGLDKKVAKDRLFQLFPYGYVQQACKIAGMIKPRAWSTG